MCIQSPIRRNLETSSMTFSRHKHETDKVKSLLFTFTNINSTGEYSKYILVNNTKSKISINKNLLKKYMLKGLSTRVGIAELSWNNNLNDRPVQIQHGSHVTEIWPDGLENGGAFTINCLSYPLNEEAHFSITFPEDCNIDIITISICLSKV